MLCTTYDDNDADLEIDAQAGESGGEGAQDPEDTHSPCNKVPYRPKQKTAVC